MDRIIGLLLIAPPILFALTVHEYAHGWMALRFGDPTAKDAGRLTLNPLSHLDPIGTIMLFIVHLGWAKPVPVNPYYFRNPKSDMMWVSLAGPGANLLTAFACGLVLRIINPFSGSFQMGSSVLGILVMMIVYGMMINLVLAFFNLIPLPPLDGSKILMGLLPAGYEYQMIQLERIGPFLLIGIIVMGNLAGVPILWGIIGPFVSFFSFVFAGADLSGFF
ncbi:MAG: site-2 protease family protein [candidate division Zixibacteria bacterium]|nr:site-2 protease family protein [candidate division Zixibacteria bacterium]